LKEEYINHNELMEFKRNVHNPLMQKIFERINLKDGSTFIDCIHISYLDGRNTGHDIRIYASGFEFADGNSEKYEREMFDVSVSEFMEEIKEIPFIFDGKVFIEDENFSVNLETVLCSVDNVIPLFPEVADIQPKHRLFQSMEYEKLKYLYSVKAGTK
jgi:hypothetical protein